MRFRLTTNKVLTSVIVLVLLIFIAILFLLIRETSQAKNDAALVAHTQQVLFQTSKVLASITDNETGLRGFVITGKQEFLRPPENLKEAINQQIYTLTQFTQNNPGQQQRIDSLRLYVNKRILFSDTTVQIRKDKGLQAAIEKISAGEGKSYMDSIRNILGAMEQEENILLKERQLKTEKNNILLEQIFFTIIFVSFILVFIFLRKDRLHIIAQKKAEATLKKREDYFRLLSNSVKDYAIFMLDADGMVSSWSIGAEYIKGYKEEEIIGKSFEVFYSEEDIKKGEPAHNLKMARDLGNYEAEGWRVRKDGTAFWADVVFTALRDETGILYGYSKITRDIRERKKVQEELELLYLQINQSNDAIYTVDANMKIRRWNKGAESLYGFSKAEVIGKDPNEMLNTDISEEDFKAALEQISKNDYWTGELKRKTKGGANIHVHSSTNVIRNSNANIDGYVAVSFDITEQKQLREQLNHLARIVEESTEAIISIGLDRKIISWNKGAEKLHGYSKEEAIGKTSGTLHLTKIPDNEIAAIIQQLIEKGYWNAEMDFYHKDGSSFFGSVAANSIKNEQGEITSLFFIIKDTSIRKQLEEQLKRNNEELEEKVQARTEDIQRSEIRYHYLFENNPLPMWIIDLQSFKFLDVNEMATLQYGYSREEFLSMTAVDIRPEEEKTSFIQADHTFESDATEYNRGIWKHRKKDGTIIDVEIIAHKIIFEGLSARLILSNNITEKKKAEEKLVASEKRFHHALDSMIEGVQIHDFNWRYIYVNDALVTYSKYSREELLGYTPMEKYPGIEQTDLFKVLERCMNERAAEHLESEFVFPDGSKGYFELSLQPVPEGIFILSVDITKRKLAEEGIKKLNVELEDRVTKRTQELKKANEELEAFSYSVSHDLRAPLRAIIGFSAILEEDYSNKLDDEAKRITAVIKNNTAKMGKLIDDLLTFSRMGRHEISKTNIDITEMVYEIINGISSNGHSKTKWVIHSLPAVNADMNMMRQVWINLISNAVKYSGNTAIPEIEIGSFKDDGNIVFFVEDNGVGFDEKYKNKLFKVFQRLHSNEEFEGTGIGLAIVEKIVSKHGGHVWAEAALNKGASFYFSLPEN